MIKQMDWGRFKTGSKRYTQIPKLESINPTNNSLNKKNRKTSLSKATLSQAISSVTLWIRPKTPKSNQT